MEHDFDFIKNNEKEKNPQLITKKSIELLNFLVKDFDASNKPNETYGFTNIIKLLIELYMLIIC